MQEEQKPEVEVVKINPDVALKYDQGMEKLPWDLLPVEAIEGMLRVLLYGKRKYSVCGQCGAKIYPNPRLDGDLTRNDCPECGSKDIRSGAENWRKGFEWRRLIAACFRHLKAILQGEDIDNGTPGTDDKGSGQPHVDHLMCMTAFLSGHMKCSYGNDDRWKK
jgi:DNA-directed RNA polymerase subunit RPC12/RpoP